MPLNNTTEYNKMKDSRINRMEFLKQPGMAGVGTYVMSGPWLKCTMITGNFRKIKKLKP